MNKRRKLAYLAAATTAIIWGAAMPVVKPALDIIDPHQFLFLRFALSGVLLLPIIIYHIGKKTFPFRLLPTIIGLETVSMLALYLIYLGLDHTQALQASFIINTKPIFVTLAGIFILREKEENHELLGLVLAVIGTALVLSSPLIFAHTAVLVGSKVMWGNIIVLAAVFVDVYYLTRVKNLYPKVSKSLIVALSSLVGLVLFGAIDYLSGETITPTAITNPAVLLAVLYMGTLGTILAFMLNLFAYTNIEASEASLFEYLNPLVYIPLSVFWLKDVLFPTQLVGIIIIGLGVFIAEKRYRRFKNASPLVKYLSDTAIKTS